MGREPIQGESQNLAEIFACISVPWPLLYEWPCIPNRKRQLRGVSSREGRKARRPEKGQGVKGQGEKRKRRCFLYLKKVTPPHGEWEGVGRWDRHFKEDGGE